MSYDHSSPGPWKVVTYPRQGDDSPRPTMDIKVVDTDGDLVAYCGWMGYSHHDANAQLIAAAPWLLAALQELLAITDDFSGESETKDWPEQDRARAAIAMAIGSAS